MNPITVPTEAITGPGGHRENPVIDGRWGARQPGPAERIEPDRPGEPQAREQRILAVIDAAEAASAAVEEALRGDATRRDRADGAVRAESTAPPHEDSEQVEITDPALRVLGSRTVLVIEPPDANPRRILEIVHQGSSSRGSTNDGPGVPVRVAPWSEELASHCRLLAWDFQRVEIEAARADEVLPTLVPAGWKLTIEPMDHGVRPGRAGFAGNAWLARAFDPQNDWRRFEAGGNDRAAAGGALVRRFRAVEAALAAVRRSCPPDWILADDALPECAPDGTWLATAINVANGRRVEGRADDPLEAITALDGRIEVAEAEARRLAAEAVAARAAAPRGVTATMPALRATIPARSCPPGHCQRCGKAIALYRPGQRFGPECARLVLAGR
jgi:hypothetical protein